jgi:hypothetical protein
MGAAVPATWPQFDEKDSPRCIDTRSAGGCTAQQHEQCLPSYPANHTLCAHALLLLRADKDYKKSHLGSEWKKPFAGASHAKGIVLEKM